MDSEIIDVVTGWDSAPAGSGYGGLQSLAADGFTGAVVAGMTWGFMLNGRLLGVFDGRIEDFEDESFKAYRAPDTSLPLLYAMQETGGDVRAQYYTEETPLKDADGTLSAGGFTGYIELSENVLSGDYYVVYHGGKSMSAAYVGNSKRLITGDDAFERANDEVGIYKVYDVDIELVDIPDDGSEDDSVAPAAVDTAEEDEAVEGTDDEISDSPADTVSDSPTEPVESDDAPAPDSEPDAETPAPDEPASSSASTTSDSDVDAPSADATQAPASESATAAGADAASAESESSAASNASSTSAGPSSEPSAASDATSKNGSDGSQTAAESESEESGSGDDVFSAEAQWRNARSIPSLDPGNSKRETAAKRNAKSAERARRPKSQAPKPKRTQKQTSTPASSARTQSPKQTQVDSDAAEALEATVSKLKSERDRLESERDSLRDERDEYQSRATELEARVEELEAEVDRLEAKLDEVGVHDTAHSMSPDEALQGTNLFVRYARKGEATLEKAHAGQAKREDVVGNLRLEHHTTFDTDGLGVEGRPYEEFLEDTPEYGFAKWVVTDLLYEIGETGNRTSLAGVFDSIPDIDRIELYGTVSVPIAEDETEPRNFDIIFRDQMGDPLFVANMNDSRDPATKPMVSQLVKDSRAVAEANETLGSAFVVTASFFEPEALEVAAEKTGGGLLSRSKRKSYVKLSRKNGYHLCLVEGRSGEFHLNVPDI
ncbi:hypothetical protein ACH9L7_07145 [Haloferax sp. S1W]|uniref:DUF7527 domain-containing protein n=1 Tax=Haloferax sp. S1W TaxID=3377110 RepID=UPI0037C53FF2